MYKIRISIILLFVLSILNPTLAHNSSKKDSLINILNNYLHDTTRINILLKLSQKQYTYDTDQRLLWLSEALSLAKTNKRKDKEALVNQNMAIVYIQDLDSLNGFKKLNLANEYYKEKGTNFQKAKQLAYYGYFYGMLNCYQQCIEYNKKALEISENKKQQLEIYYLLGSSYIYIGEYEFALMYLLEGAKIADEINNQSIKTEINMNLGALYLQLKNYNKALSCYTLAAEVKRNLNDKEALVVIYFNIGKIHRLQQNDNNAYKTFINALSLAREIKDKRILPLILGKLGDIASIKGNFNEAEKYLKEALTIDQSKRNSEIFYYLGNLYSRKREYNKAINFYNQGIEIANQNNQLVTLKHITEKLSIIYNTTHQYKNAYNYLRLHLIAKDSILNEDIITRISNIQIQHEVEKKNSEILVLQKDNELKELNLSKRKSVIMVLVMGLLLFLAIIIISIQRYRYVKKISAIKLKKTMKSHEVEKKTLEQQIQSKNHELTNHIMHVTEKNEFVAYITTKLQGFSPYLKKDKQIKLEELISELKANTKDNIWQEFDIRFNEIQKDFNDKLISKFPNLTTSERRLCSFLRMNMTSKEISIIMHQSSRGIDTARYRLRKKLNITDPNVNLNSFLAEL